MKLRTIQEEILALLGSDAWLLENSVPALGEDLGDVVARMDREMASRNICALVMTPSFTVTSRASKTLVGDATVVVQIIETPGLNRRKANHATAQDAAEYIAWMLNLRVLSSDCGVLTATGISSHVIGTKHVAYNVAFKIKTDITNPVNTEDNKWQ